MTARDFFFDAAGTLRPPWRLVVFGASIVVSLAVVSGAVVPLVSAALSSVGVRLVVYPWALLGAALLAHILTFRWVEPRGWAAVGLDSRSLRARPVTIAALLGGLAVLVPSLALISAGWLAIVPSGEGSSTLAAVSVALFLAPAAFWEELLFRGYAFAVLREWWGAPAALGVTSLVFGLVHLQNAGATPMSIASVVLAGVFLGGVLLATRSLYAAFAAHFAWNWTLAALLHSAVSGVPFTTPDYRLVDAGPDWATGGVWGPEGGVPAAVGLLSASIYLYLRRRRREES